MIMNRYKHNQWASLAHLSQRRISKLIGYSWSGVVRCRRRHHSQCSKIFSETDLPIKAKFHMEPPWVGGTIFCSRHLCHMTKMAATPIYGKNPSTKFQTRFILLNQILFESFQVQGNEHLML